jgi:hypothetical protein
MRGGKHVAREAKMAMRDVQMIVTTVVFIALVLTLGMILNVYSVTGIGKDLTNKADSVGAVLDSKYEAFCHRAGKILLETEKVTDQMLANTKNISYLIHRVTLLEAQNAELKARIENIECQTTRR